MFVYLVVFLVCLGGLFKSVNRDVILIPVTSVHIVIYSQPNAFAAHRLDILLLICTCFWGVTFTRLIG